MTREFGLLESASPSAIVLLVVVTLILLAAIVVHRSITQSPAARHAVMLATLLTIGLCPVMVVVARLAAVRAQIRLPNPMPIDYLLGPAHSAAFLESAEPDVPATHFRWAGVLLGLWAAGSVGGLVRLILGWHAMNLVRHGAKPGAPESMAPLRHRLAAALGGNPPEILVSDEVEVPVALGCLRSMVLLPAGFFKRFNDYQLFQMLVHECAHALRRDTLVGFYQRLLAAVLWFHPLIYMANRFLDRAREEVCDNYVLEFVPSGEYSRTLLLVAQSLSPLPNRWFAPTISRSARQLEDRVRGLLNPRRSIMIRLTSKKMALITAGFIASALVLSCLSATPGTALAQSTSEQDPNSALRPPKGASVAIVVFQDLQCPRCRSDAPIEEQAARTHNVPLVRHDFPLPMHTWSYNAAVMARYFDSLGKDLGNQFRDYIFEHQPEITPDNLQGFAEKFTVEHNVQLPFVIDPQQEFAAQVNADEELGRKINIRHTPTIFVVSSKDPAAPLVEVTDTNRLFETVEAVEAQ